MTNCFTRPVSVLALFLVPAAVHAGLIVDGHLGDWGVVVADNNGSTYSFLPGLDLLGWHIEDQDDKAGHGFVLGPNQGGQDYDAEMMAVALQGGRIHIAIVTGQRPDNGLASFGPGDIRIETASGTLGIEVGGGAGGAGGSLITAGAPGSTYTLDGNGVTKSHMVAAPAQVAGSIWSQATWLLDPISPKGPVQMEINTGSTLLGTADYVYTRDSLTAQHAVIELSFDLALVGGPGESFSVHWRPSCGNDELDVYALVPVPEPSVLVMTAISAAMTFVRRRR